MPFRLSVLLAVLAWSTPTPRGLFAQETAPTPGRIGLAEAMARADRQAYPNRAALAELDGQSARRASTLRGLLPTVRAEAGWMRTTDPLNAFGFALRQRGLSQASFDPARLNDPLPISDLTGGLVIEQPLVNPDVWLARSAAGTAVEAAERMTDWTRESVRLQVAQAWFGGVLAAEKVAALEAGFAAGRSHVRMANSLLEQGMVTRSDLLLAEVRTGEVETQLIGARGELTLAARRLALAIGAPADTLVALPTTLPAADALRAFAASTDAAGPRDDVAAAELGHQAARQDLSRARATMLPRINSFARYEWHDGSGLYSGKPAWTVGVMASWSLFGGGSELAETRAARARAEGAKAQAEAARAQAELELVQRRTDLSVALAALDIAERAVTQSAEARRIVDRKYQGGLATVTELLEATAVETRTRLEFAAARYRVIVAAAGWRLAAGQSLTALTRLDLSPAGADARAAPPLAVPQGAT